MIAAMAAEPAGDFFQTHVWMFVAGFLVFFVALWSAILTLIGRASGWAELAAHYRASAPFQGETWMFQGVQMRYLMHYNGCITFGASEMGVYVAGWGPFRLGAPPLLVPWGDVTIAEKKRFVFPGYELRFRQSPEVFMWVRERLGQRLLQASKQPAAGFHMAPPIG